MPGTAHNTVAVVGVDIGKNSFHVVGLDQRDAIVLREKRPLGQVEAVRSNGRSRRSSLPAKPCTAWPSKARGSTLAEVVAMVEKEKSHYREKGLMKKVWPKGLSVGERIEIARERLPKIVDDLISLMHLHESNRIICYSDQLSSQIPQSYAGHHFRLFQQSMLASEALRLCTVWDPSKEDRNSVPTLAALIDDGEVLAEIKHRAIEYRKNDRHIDAGDDLELHDLLVRDSDKYVEEMAAEQNAALVKALLDIHSIEQSDMLKAVRQFRHFHLAHSLDDEAKVRPDLPYRYGNDKTLLELTMPILDKLYIGVCQTGFTWGESRLLAKDYAAALWNGCRFEVLR